MKSVKAMKSRVLHTLYFILHTSFWWSGGNLKFITLGSEGLIRDCANWACITWPWHCGNNFSRHGATIWIFYPRSLWIQVHLGLVFTAWRIDSRTSVLRLATRVKLVSYISSPAHLVHKRNRTYAANLWPSFIAMVTDALANGSGAVWWIEEKRGLLWIFFTASQLPGSGIV